MGVPAGMQGSHEHLVRKRLAPVQDLDALPQSEGVERVGLHQFQDGSLRRCFDDPEPALRHGTRLDAQGTCDQNRVAVLRDRVTEWGGRLDHAVDRVGDVVLAVLLWRAGAPVELAGLTGLAVLAVEGVRVWRHDVVRLTVGERPVRLLLTASALLVAPVWWAAALLVLSVVAVGQLLLAVSGSWPFRNPSVGGPP